MRSDHGSQCILVLLVLTAVIALAACGKQKPAVDVGPVDTGIDFSVSAYKHITNGGVTDHEKLPYNIDAITGATQTVEGPGVVTSIPLSVREIENAKSGLARGAYTDTKGMFLYEGMDLYCMLHEMREGDNGIVLTDTAHSVTLKDANRRTIATLTLAQIEKAHEVGRPVLIAYGIGAPDGSIAAPFVFDGASGESHSLGYIESLDNEDGCLKLVYDFAVCGASDSYRTFSNVAYLYVEEAQAPGFRHTGAVGSVYDTPNYTDYLITFRGEALGREYVLSVRDLEQLAAYGASGELIGGGIGYAAEYSLANNAYWYVNRYEGLDLYKLLQYLGMRDAETMGMAAARTTMVNFIAADGVPSTETFSVDTLSYPDTFGFYKKNAADLGDGTYVSTPDDLVDTGYPVLLAYGVNRYPYTVSKNDVGYLSGLSNSGGPMRVVFGKTEYNHANGSRQVQYVRQIVVGKDRLYSTHFDSDVAALHRLAEECVQVTVASADGAALIDRVFTVEAVEKLLFGEGVSAAEQKEAHVKALYPIADSSAQIYEGVDLSYFLMQTLSVPGTTGTVTFVGETEEVTVTLDAILAGPHGGGAALRSILAFAKNGSPLAEHRGDAGYVESVPLRPYLDSDPERYPVQNVGGPLMAVLVTQTDGTVQVVENLQQIRVALLPDAYAHLTTPYDALADCSVRVFGEGLIGERTYTVSEHEGRQRDAATLDYSVLGPSGILTEQRYRGLYLFGLFAEIGIQSNAGDVIVRSADGTEITVPLSLLKGQRFENYADSEKSPLWSMLCFGRGEVDAPKEIGTPLTADGPLYLTVPQRDAADVNQALCLANVSEIEVTANDVDTWGHSMGDVFGEFLPYAFTLTVRNDDSEWSHVFTLEQLEQLKQVIVRDTYTVLDLGTCEGLDLWKFVTLINDGQIDLTAPISVTVYAADGYKNDLLATYGMDALEHGVAASDGSRKPILLCYAINGYPLVDSAEHEGYTGIAGNTAGPIRCVAENVQGASVKYLNKLVVSLAGSGEIAIRVDAGRFSK